MTAYNEEVKKFLNDQGIEEGKTYKFTFQEFKNIHSGAMEIDYSFGAIVMDCFEPTGPAVEPGYEDSCSYYALR